MSGAPLPADAMAIAAAVGARETSAAAIAAAALERIRTYDAIQPQAWISRFADDEILATARGVDARIAAGETLPLAGVPFAVKDNIDVAGRTTTAGLPGLARRAEVTATCVARLQAAGAIYVGKTNLDQLATGLVGTRSPYGTPRNPIDPALVAGGSSSGSAVAVALGHVPLALGTDTAGSGRVPAAMCGGTMTRRPLLRTAGL